MSALNLNGATVQSSHIDLAHRLADAAGEIIRPVFRKPLKVFDKDDASPVTEVDKSVETTLSKMISLELPDHSIFGEEFGMKLGQGEGKRYLWVLDPVDGTQSFITGKCTFGVLIALLYDGRPLLGVIDQPVLRDRWIGVKGQTTLHNGQPVRVRNCDSLRSAYVYSTTPEMFYDETVPPYKALTECVKSYQYGADCCAYGQLAMGMVDAVFEADLGVYDYMPMVPIVEGAGGVMTDWSGRELVWDGVKENGQQTWSTEVLAVGDPRLHKEILKRIDFGG